MINFVAVVEENKIGICAYAYGIQSLYILCIWAHKR